MKKKHVETFRNIRYPVSRIYYYYTDSEAAVGPLVGLAQARPNDLLSSHLAQNQQTYEVL